MVEWKQLNWRKLEKVVSKLQKRIFRAAVRGDVKAVRRLQKTLMRSYSAKCLAVRKVTQDNKGKKTAGVDGIKSLTPAQRFILVSQLKLTGKSKPTRRVWIDKPGKAQKRPLGIPTMFDRGLQALVKLALEPEWEAVFESNSYGFRPGRSCHDAIGAIFDNLSKKTKYVLEADISKCFDKINHSALLKKINTFPTLRKQIHAWLKAGVMDNLEFTKTDEGSPQGGGISPLLANIALHGLEEKVKGINGVKIIATIRYADDFVIIHENEQHLKHITNVVAQWLRKMGLELNPSKTSICHSSEGFNFLGFNIRQYSVGAYRASKSTSGKNLGFKLLIKPSLEAIKKHLNKIRKIIDTHHNAPQAALIKRLNPVIRGWCNYYSTVTSKKTFSTCDNLTYQKLFAWAKRKCTKTNRHETVSKYWGTHGNSNWSFQTKDGHRLIRHSEKPIKRHIKVRSNRSPFDGDVIYWSQRIAKHPEISKEVSKLLRKQKGKCQHCGMHFKDGDVWEVDHILPTSLGGKNVDTNKQLLHRHCHDTKTTNDGSIRYS